MEAINEAARLVAKAANVLEIYLDRIRENHEIPAEILEAIDCLEESIALLTNT